MDEPLAALDVSVRRDVRRFLAARVRKLGMPTVIVTHDLADAEALDGEIVVIEAGRVAQAGRLADLAARPQTAFVRQFVAGRAP
jgi:ABC-type sulfate/molybdate transport systems ATPase subunit